MARLVQDPVLDPLPGDGGSALVVPVGHVDLQRRLVHRADGGRERLTSLEVSALGYLAAQRGRVVPREELMHQVWGYDPGALSRTCDTTIGRLRTKIEVDPADPEALLTVRGLGYILVDPNAPSPSPPARPEATEAHDRRIQLGDRWIDLRRARVDTPTGPIELTGNELAVIEALIAARGAPIDRDALQRKIWGSPAGRPVDNAVMRIRRKLEPDPRRPRFLVTTALGYRLDLGDPAGPAAAGTLALAPLPTERDARFGRDEELAAVIARLRAGDRLMTLVGPGGVGKTRLALAVAWAMVVERPTGWVDLAAARSVDRVLAALAGVARTQLGDGDPLALLGEALRSLGPALLVVDNVEQLPPDAVAALTTLLDRAEGLALVLTSRIPLKIRGERRITVGPLARAESIALFVDRSARPLEPAEVAEIDGLAEALDDLPLAIELAAARTAVLRVRDLRERTADRLRALSVADPSRPDRHRSMRASLDATWALLRPPARATLAELTVFGGPFSLALAEEVAAPPDDLWVVDLVEELVDAHLVRRDPDTGRLSMPVLVREHAAEALTPRDREHAELRHGRALADLARPAILGDLDGPGGIEVRAALALDLEDLLLAGERAIERADPGVAVDALTGAWEVIELRGPYALLSGRIDALVALPMDAEVRTRALLLAGRVLATEGRFDLADERLSEAARLAAQLGSARLGVEAHLHLSRVQLERWALPSAEADANVALTLSRTLDAPILEARSLVALGTALRRRFRADQAEQVLATSVRLAADHGAARCEAEARRELGTLQLREEPFTRAVALARDLGDGRLEALILMSAAITGHQRGDVVWEQLVGLADRFRAMGDSASELRALIRAANDLCSLHDYDRAEPLVERARRLTTTLGAHWAEDGVLLHGGQVAAAQGRRDEARRAFEDAVAVARRLGHPSVEALSLDKLAKLVAEEDPERAERIRTEILAPLEATGNRLALATAHTRLASSAMDRRDWDTATRWCRSALEIAEAHRFLEVAIGTHTLLAEIAIGQGDHARAWTELALAERTIGEVGPRIRVQFLVGAAGLGLALGDRARARAFFDEAERTVASDLAPGLLEGPRRRLRAQLEPASE